MVFGDSLSACLIYLHMVFLVISNLRILARIFPDAPSIQRGRTIFPFDLGLSKFSMRYPKTTAFLLVLGGPVGPVALHSHF